MRSVILVPRRSGIADRDRLWDFTRTWWANDHPGCPIVEGHHDTGPFNRSAAINRAAREAGDWDVAIIIDADVLADRDAVRAGVDMAFASNRPVLAYHERVHLTAKGTERILGGYRNNWRAPGFVANTFTNSCSSCVIVSRQLFDACHGFDERFVGWGWEDVAFRVAAETLAGGQMVKLASTLWHLHHRISHENNRRERTFLANEARGERYKAAHWDVAAISALVAETADPQPELGPTRIPRILHRTVPAAIDDQVEGWWEHWRQLHPGWDLRTYRDPLDPEDWPLTSHAWAKCGSGAQLAGLIRLEALATAGGVYVDSDVEPYRTLEPLLQLPGFAAWEDAKVVPDAVLGFEPGHPAVRIMLDRAVELVAGGAGAWDSGPGVVTGTLPGRHDVLLLPPGSFFPYHYSEKKQRRGEDHMGSQPWSFAAHHWHASWVPKR